MQHQQYVKKDLPEWRGTLPALSLAVSEKSCAALFCMAPHSQAVQHLERALLVRCVRIIAICFGIVHWTWSKLLSTASTADTFPQPPPTTATLLVQLPRSLHVFVVSKRPR